MLDEGSDDSDEPFAGDRPAPAKSSTVTPNISSQVSRKRTATELSASASSDSDDAGLDSGPKRGKMSERQGADLPSLDMAGEEWALVDSEMSSPTIASLHGAENTDEWVEKVLSLLSRGADIEALENGYTPLMTACVTNAHRIAYILLSHGANPSAMITKDINGSIVSQLTPLHLACRNGSGTCVDVLIARWGLALLEATDSSGKRPEDYCDDKLKAQILQWRGVFDERRREIFRTHDSHLLEVRRILAPISSRSRPLAEEQDPNTLEANSIKSTVRPKTFNLTRKPVRKTSRHWTKVCLIRISRSKLSKRSSRTFEKYGTPMLSALRSFEKRSRDLVKIATGIRRIFVSKRKFWKKTRSLKAKSVGC